VVTLINEGLQLPHSLHLRGILAVELEALSKIFNYNTINNYY
jgi:hypothetical protein